MIRFNISPEILLGLLWVVGVTWILLPGAAHQVSAEEFVFQTGSRGDSNVIELTHIRSLVNGARERKAFARSVDYLSRSDRQVNVSVEASVILHTEYVWRGKVLSDKPTAQPSITLGFGNSGLAFNVFGSAAVQDRDTVGVDTTDEVNLTLSYDRNIGGPGRALGISVGYTQYVYPRLSGANHSEEVFVGIGLGSPLQPAVTVFYDFGLRNSIYATFGFNPEFTLDGEGAQLVSVRASVGFSDERGSFAFNDVTVSVSASVRKGALSVGPVAQFVLADTALNIDKDKLWGGLELRLSY